MSVVVDDDIKSVTPNSQRNSKSPLSYKEGTDRLRAQPNQNSVFMETQ